jgi:hypothetical protein
MTFVLTEECAMSMLFRVIDAPARAFQRFGVLTLPSSNPDPRDTEFVTALLANLDEITRRELRCLRYEDGKHAIRIF